jgi:hypothetical protein
MSTDFEFASGNLRAATGHGLAVRMHKRCRFNVPALAADVHIE